MQGQRRSTPKRMHFIWSSEQPHKLGHDLGVRAGWEAEPSVASLARLPI